MQVDAVTRAVLDRHVGQIDTAGTERVDPVSRGEVRRRYRAVDQTVAQPEVQRGGATWELIIRDRDAALEDGVEEFVVGATEGEEVGISDVRTAPREHVTLRRADSAAEKCGEHRPLLTCAGSEDPIWKIAQLDERLIRVGDLDGVGGTRH